MTGPLPKWGLKNIEPETKTAVAKAAQREGMEIGKWANRVLLAAAQATLTDRRDVAVVEPAPAPEPALPVMDRALQAIELLDRVATTAQRIEALSDSDGGRRKRRLLKRLDKALSA